MAAKLSNNASGTLASGITDVATSISLTSGHGARFPSLTSPEYFYATLVDSSLNVEIVKVTARSTDTLTVARAQDNSTARAFSTGDVIEMRPIAALLHEKANVESAVGQCRLVKNGSNLELQRYNGRYIFINGSHVLIPSTAPTLAPTSLTAGLYYIYAYVSGSTLTLEASTTVSATDSTYGHQIKDGDATRTLVGLAYTTDSTWRDADATRLVISYFNRKTIRCNGAAFDGITTTSTGSQPPADLGSSYYAKLVTWGDEALLVGIRAAQLVENTAGQTVYLYAGIDGSTNASGTAAQYLASTGVGYGAASSSAYEAGVGYHYFPAYGQVTGGTATFYGSVTILMRG